MDELKPKSVYQRATKLFHSGFTRPALDIIKIELQAHPDQGELWLLLSTILHSEAKWPEALEAMETASTLVPRTAGSELVLADCYSHLGKHELAVHSYKHLLSAPSLPVDYYAGLYAGFKRAGRYELAMSACRKAIETAPDNDEAYFGMAHCMSALAYPPRQVTTILRKALGISPDKSQYRISLALQLSLTEKRSQAYAVLTKRSPDILETLSCNCMARQLMELCVWAGDQERCSKLGAILARLAERDAKARETTRRQCNDRS